MPRVKHRWLLFQLRTPRMLAQPGAADAKLQKIKEKLLADCILAKCSELFGWLGVGQFRAGARLVFWSPLSGLGLLKVRCEAFEYAAASLALLTQVDEQPVNLQTLSCSGTLSSTRRRLRRLLEGCGLAHEFAGVPELLS